MVLSKKGGGGCRVLFRLVIELTFTPSSFPMGINLASYLSVSQLYAVKYIKVSTATLICKKKIPHVTQKEF
jgi:hypothetical protein